MHIPSIYHLLSSFDFGIEKKCYRNIKLWKLWNSREYMKTKSSWNSIKLNQDKNSSLNKYSKVAWKLTCSKLAEAFGPSSQTKCHHTCNLAMATASVLALVIFKTCIISLHLLGQVRISGNHRKKEKLQVLWCIVNESIEWHVESILYWSKI